MCLSAWQQPFHCSMVSHQLGHAEGWQEAHPDAGQRCNVRQRKLGHSNHCQLPAMIAAGRRHTKIVSNVSTQTCCHAIGRTCSSNQFTLIDCKCMCRVACGIRNPQSRQQKVWQGHQQLSLHAMQPWRLAQRMYLPCLGESCTTCSSSSAATETGSCRAMKLSWLAQVLFSTSLHPLLRSPLTCQRFACISLLDGDVKENTTRARTHTHTHTVDTRPTKQLIVGEGHRSRQRKDSVQTGPGHTSASAIFTLKQWRHVQRRSL